MWGRGYKAFLFVKVGVTTQNLVPSATQPVSTREIQGNLVTLDVDRRILFEQQGKSDLII